MKAWDLDQWLHYAPDLPAPDSTWEQTVNNLILSEQVKKHPKVVEAIAKGYNLEIQGGDVGFYVSRAEKYLAQQALASPTNDITTNPVTEPVTANNDITWVDKPLKEIARERKIAENEVKRIARSGADWVRFKDGRYQVAVPASGWQGQVQTA